MFHRNRIHLICLLFCHILWVVSADDAGEKESRHFSLFSVVTFKNDECTTTSGGLSGTCMAASDCTGTGKKAGNCAAGFGVCCLHSLSTCGTSSSKNCTYIESPSYPTAYTTAGSCSYTIKRASTDICQVRIDFTAVTLSQPNPTAGTTSGACLSTKSYVDITAGSASNSITSNPPLLCGTLTGQHIYLDSGRAETAATLKFTIGASTTSNTWRIKASQLECSHVNKAPNGCMQYFYGAQRHTVTSFNFDGTKTCSTGCLLADSMYSICFRPEKGMCGNTFMQTTAASGKDTWDFPELQSDAIAEIGAGEVAQAGCAAIAETDGYLAIINTVAANSNLFCGSGVLAPTDGATIAQPVEALEGAAWTIDVVTKEDLESAQAGFSIYSQQKPC